MLNIQDHFCVCLHLRLECVHYQVLNPGIVSTYLRTFLAWILLRRPYDGLSSDKPHRSSVVHATTIVLLESVVRGRGQSFDRRSKGSRSF
jgi:hypothetical protein